MCLAGVVVVMLLVDVEGMVEVREKGEVATVVVTFKPTGLVEGVVNVAVAEQLAAFTVSTLGAVGQLVKVGGGLVGQTSEVAGLQSSSMPLPQISANGVTVTVLVQMAMFCPTEAV